MSIRKKLILSHIAMIVIPVLLTALTAALFIHVASKDASGRVFSSSWHSGGGSSGGGGDWADGFLFAAGSAPGLLADERFLAETEQRLTQMDMALVVERQGGLAYASPSLGAGGSELLDDLGRYGSSTERRHPGPPGRHPFRWSGTSYTVEQRTIAASDDTVYLLTDNGPTMRMYRTVGPAMFLSLLIGIALTNGLLSYFVSRSIVRPLRALKTGAERIKEGNLDEPMALGRKDEIGKTMAAFEEMRLRLKESIAVQLQYEDNRKELLSNISHDLRTPIAAVSGCVEGLRTGIADTEEKRQKYLDMIHRKVTDMSRMIEELFLFSRLDLHQVPFDFESIDPAAYLRDAADELRSDPRASGVEIELRLPEPVPGSASVRVLADREKLGRVLANVIDNSLKHMDKAEKRLALELRADDRSATLLIRDNGRGIGERALPRIFDRFYRTDPARSADAGGSGLGLAIVKEIMDAHGGRVDAWSAEGEGTTVALTLKRTEAGAGAGMAPENGLGQGGGADARADSDH